MYSYQILITVRDLVTYESLMKLVLNVIDDLCRRLQYM